MAEKKPKTHVLPRIRIDAEFAELIEWFKEECPNMNFSDWRRMLLEDAMREQGFTREGLRAIKALEK